MWQSELCCAGAMAEGSGMTYERAGAADGERRAEGPPGLGRVGWPRSYPAPVGEGRPESSRSSREGTLTRAP